MGISLGMAALNVYHNNFINNTQHVYDTLWHPLNRAQPVTYVWDDGAQGNYWSDHNATDADNDGVADTPYVINQWSNNIDRYPLMEPIQVEFKLPVEPELTPSPEPTPSAAPFPTTIIAAASVASIAIVTIALIIYFKKRKH
jgi:hypothetical protein